MIDWGLLADIFTVVGVILAVAFYFGDYRRARDQEKQRRWELATGILAGLKEELELNWQWMKSILKPQGQHFSDYFEPSGQVFRFRDDMVSAALHNPEFDPLRTTGLSKTLLSASSAIRVVNLQVEELISYRFGQPDKLADASEFVLNRPGILEALSKAPVSGNLIIQTTGRKEMGVLPEVKFLRGLGQRNWAIVNEGLWKRLKPALQQLKPVLDDELSSYGLEPLQFN